MTVFISLPKSKGGSIYRTIKIGTTKTRVNCKSAYTVESPPESFVDVLKVADIRFFRILGNCC